MNYDKNSFLAGLSVGRTLKGWSGGGVITDVQPKEVNFYDYDGTLLYAFTVADVLNLTSLPDAPYHKGLKFQSWNWSLQDLKSFKNFVDVGATYITDDGKTRLYLSIPPANGVDGKTDLESITIYINQSVSNGVEIDWGDGSQIETISGTGDVSSTPHAYANSGNFVVSLNPLGDCKLSLGGTASYLAITVLGGYGDTEIAQRNTLKKVEIGKNVTSLIHSFTRCFSLCKVTIPEYCEINSSFSGCKSLKFVSVPNGNTDLRIGFDSCSSLQIASIPPSVSDLYSCFDECSSLQNAPIYNGLSEMGPTVFFECTSLGFVYIPNSISSIGVRTFYACDSLISVTIPESVKSISNFSFGYCKSLKIVHMLGETPPEIQSDSFETYSGRNYVFYVPKGSLDTYKSAPNWSDYADNIREEP